MSDRLRVPFPFELLKFSFVRMLSVWCGVAILIFLMQIAICGIVHDNANVRAMLNFIDMLPSIVRSALGGQSLRLDNMPALIAIGYQHPFVLFLYMFFAVSVPTGLLTGEVQKGTMELVLSRSVTKTQVYICAGVPTLVGMFALVMVMFLGTVIGTNIYEFSEPVRLPFPWQ